ncbi:hypothetical protein ACJIZ3_021830 [Penstemon smallii]|uniref:Uncharacterized protein n=1 Tax=Penstemon smallii TaxID=265156 RepID=A0ABD3SMI7_9LAMI
MKAICYSEHAIKVSDSYCSGFSNQAYNNSPKLNPSIQDTVACIYKIKLSTEKQLRIRITWGKSKLGFSISISDYPFSSSKFSKNSRTLTKARGTKTFDSCGFKIEVLWDLNRAQYDSGPEPVSGFYVLVLVNSELSLILGDVEQELEIKKRVSDIQKSELSLISRNEYFSGNGLYSSRAKFSETGSFHDILVKCFPGEERSKLKNPVLSVFIDNKNVIEVKRLQWNFRGNQTIFLDGLLVDMMWDVYDWFFGSSSSSGYSVFMFRTRSGLDSRLWFEEKNFEQNEHEKVGFSLMICACKNPD